MIPASSWCLTGFPPAIGLTLFLTGTRPRPFSCPGCGLSTGLFPLLAERVEESGGLLKLRPEGPGQRGQRRLQRSGQLGEELLPGRKLRDPVDLLRAEDLAIQDAQLEGRPLVVILREVRQR